MGAFIQRKKNHLETARSIDKVQSAQTEHANQDRNFWLEGTKSILHKLRTIQKHLIQIKLYSFFPPILTSSK